ncbi:MAG: MBL fold metallo-hydrolase, partial [Myxococcales bacterium]|nr:MBL fold metallo-hydrolase [Myxococcales bacterium]
HATFALRLGGLVTVFDPIWRRGFGPRRRFCEPGLPLPKVAAATDVVLVSHNHFDHLDMGSLEAFGGSPLYVVPLGNAETLAKLGANVVELDWWQSHEHQGVRYTLVPARHWSMRMPWTRNQALWGGFVVETNQGVAYHSGDTAYFEGFSQIAQRCPAVDWAMLPIGAYDPRWFMRPQHMCPEEAGQAFLDLEAKHLVAMHWGTFKLTDEKLAEPPLRLSHWAKARGVADGSVWIMDVGETRLL